MSDQPDPGEPVEIELRELRAVKERINDLLGEGFEPNRIEDALAHINQIHDGITEMQKTSKDTASDIEAKLAIVKCAATSINELVESIQSGGSAVDLTEKSANVITAIAQFGVLAGPEGAIFAQTVSGITSLLGMALGFTKHNQKSAIELMQDAIMKQLKAEFSAAEFAQLRLYVKGQLRSMAEKTDMMKDSIAVVTKTNAPFDQPTKDRISANVSNNDGVQALGVLETYIQDNSQPTSLEKALILTKALLLYSQLVHQRDLEATQIQACYTWKCWSLSQYEVFGMSKVRAQRNAVKTASFIFAKSTIPVPKTKYLFAGIYSLSLAELNFVQKQCGGGKKFEGKPIVIKTCGGGYSIGCNTSKDARAVLHLTPTRKVTDAVAKWVMFDRAYSGSKLFFSCKASGYLFSSGYCKIDGYEQVMVWTPGNTVNNGHWKLGPTTKIGTYIMCTKNSKVLHEEDYFYAMSPPPVYDEDSNVVSAGTEYWVIGER